MPDAFIATNGGSKKTAKCYQPGGIEMARNYARMLATLIVAFLAGNGHSQTALAGFATGQAVTSAIDELRDSANDVVHNTGNEFGRAAFTTRQNAEILIQQLNLMAKDLEGKTFGDISATQQHFFINTRNTLEEMKTATNYSVTAAQRLVAQGDDMLGTLPGADRTARVLDFTPRYIISAPPGTSINVAISGSWLGSGDPSLVLANRTCSRLQKTESKLIFKCILPKLIMGSRVEYEKLKLNTADRLSFWGRLASSFGGEPTRRSYELGLAVVPRTLGTFKAQATIKTTVVEQRERSEFRRNDNKHCQGTQTYAWTINSTEGWRIVAEPTTVRESDSDATDEGVQEWSPTGFRFQGKAKNSGSCVKVLGQTIAKDGRGHVQIRARWIEARDVVKEIETPIEIGDIEWGKERSIRLPENVSFLSIRSNLVDGSSFDDTSTDASVRPWYSVSIDIQNRYLIIRPKDLEQALSKN